MMKFIGATTSLSPAEGVIKGLFEVPEYGAYSRALGVVYRGIESAPALAKSQRDVCKLSPCAALQAIADVRREISQAVCTPTGGPAVDINTMIARAERLTQLELTVFRENPSFRMVGFELDPPRGSVDYSPPRSRAFTVLSAALESSDSERLGSTALNMLPHREVELAFSSLFKQLGITSSSSSSPPKSDQATMRQWCRLLKLHSSWRNSPRKRLSSSPVMRAIARDITTTHARIKWLTTQVDSGSPKHSILPRRRTWRDSLFQSSMRIAFQRKSEPSLTKPSKRNQSHSGLPAPDTKRGGHENVRPFEEELADLRRRQQQQIQSLLVTTTPHQIGMPRVASDHCFRPLRDWTEYFGFSNSPTTPEDRPGTQTFRLMTALKTLCFDKTDTRERENLVRIADAYLTLDPQGAMVPGTSFNTSRDAARLETILYQMSRSTMHQGQVNKGIEETQLGLQSEKQSLPLLKEEDDIVGFLAQAVEVRRIIQALYQAMGGRSHSESELLSIEFDPISGIIRPPKGSR